MTGTSSGKLKQVWFAAHLALSLYPKISEHDRTNHLPTTPDHPAASAGHRTPAARRRDDSLHQPLPQGGDRFARRTAGRRRQRAVGTPHRTRGPSSNRTLDHRGTGKTDSGAPSAHRGVLGFGGAGRPLSPLQAQASHPRHGSPRAGIGAAGRPHHGPAGPRRGAAGPALYLGRSADARGGPRRSVRHHRRTHFGG